MSFSIPHNSPFGKTLSRTDGKRDLIFRRSANIVMDKARSVQTLQIAVRGTPKQPPARGRKARA